MSAIRRAAGQLYSIRSVTRGSTRDARRAGTNAAARPVIASSLDKKYGTDEEAVKTVKQWRFAPGKKDGVAVPVLLEVEMTFTIR